MIFKKLIPTIFFIFLFSSNSVNAQHEWQEPILRSRSDVDRIVGPIEQTELSKDITIVWVWGVDFDHERGYHEYDWVMDLYINKLLNKVPGMGASPPVGGQAAYWRDRWDDDF